MSGPHHNAGVREARSSFYFTAVMYAVHFSQVTFLEKYPLRAASFCEQIPCPWECIPDWRKILPGGVTSSVMEKSQDNMGSDKEHLLYPGEIRKAEVWVRYPWLSLEGWERVIQKQQVKRKRKRPGFVWLEHCQCTEGDNWWKPKRTRDTRCAHVSMSFLITLINYTLSV